MQVTKYLVIWGHFQFLRSNKQLLEFKLSEVYWSYFRFFSFKSILHLHAGDVPHKNIKRDVDEVDSERLGDKNEVLMAFVKIRNSRE